MPFYKATVHILVSAASFSEACDTVSGALNQVFLDSPRIEDWAYLRRPLDIGWEHDALAEIKVPESYMEGDIYQLFEEDYNSDEFVSEGGPWDER